MVQNRTPCDSVYAFSGQSGHWILDDRSINDNNKIHINTKDWIGLAIEMKWNHVSWVWLSWFCHRVKFTVYSAILFSTISIFLSHTLVFFAIVSYVVCAHCNSCCSRVYGPAFYYYLCRITLSNNNQRR